MSSFYGDRATPLLLTYLMWLKREKQVERIYMAAFNCHQLIEQILCLSFHEFKFLDLHPTTYEVAIADIRPSDSKSCLIYTHTLGSEFTPNEKVAALKASGAIDYAIDDRCLCNPSHHVSESSPFDATLYSFGSTKQLSLGKGGIMVVSHADALPALKQFPESGLLDTLKTDINWDKHFKRRKKRHHQLHEALGRWAVPENINQWRYSIVCNDSAGLEARIFDNDLFCSRHYQNDYARTLPVTQQLSCSIVNFFIAEEYSDAQLLQVIEITKQFLTSE